VGASCASWTPKTQTVGSPRNRVNFTLYNNLSKNEELALKIDDVVRRVRPNAFRGNQPKENVIKKAMLPLLGNDRAEVERIFLIIKAQQEY
jgi:type I restriction enzyme R subunit